MIDGVSNEVSERLGERIENALIKIGVLTGDFEGNILAAEFGDVANDPREAAEQLLDGNHANFKNALVKFVENARLEGQAPQRVSHGLDRASDAHQTPPACDATWTCR